MKAQVKQQIDPMLAAINGEDSCWTGAEYNILRVVAAFPLAADFGSKSKLVATMLKDDKHPLAILSSERLVEVLLARPESKSCLDSLRGTVKRACEKLGADNEGGPEYKKRKVSPAVVPTLD